jgi:2-oxoisovalerate dehydrogenase E2 component (dihydrolipoyl transacylase)
MDFRLPTLPQTHTVTLGRWLKQAGDKIAAHEKLLEVYAEHFDWDIPAPSVGTLQTIHAQVGAQVAVGDVLADIVSEELPVSTADNAESSRRTMSSDQSSVISELPSAIRLTPVATRIVAAHELDVSRVQGTGIGGRITKNNVLALLANDERRAMSDEQRAASDVQCPMSNVQPANNVATSNFQCPRATLFVEIDMTNVFAQCDAQQAVWHKREGFALTPLPFIVWATVNALRQMPIVNSYLVSDELRLRNVCELAVANRLIKHADGYNLIGLARRLQPPPASAPTNSAFVIHARGLLGDAEAQPLLHTTMLTSTQAACLSLGAIRKRAVVRNDALVVRPMMYVGLTFDARVMAETLAEKFLLRVKQHIEIP